MYYESASLLQLKVHVLPCLEALSFLFIVGAVMFCNNRLSQGISEISAGQNMPAPMHFMLLNCVKVLWAIYIVTRKLSSQLLNWDGTSELFLSLHKLYCIAMACYF